MSTTLLPDETEDLEFDRPSPLVHLADPNDPRNAGWQFPLIALCGITLRRPGNAGADKCVVCWELSGKLRRFDQR